MVLGFLPWAGHQGLPLEGRGEYTLCCFLFLPCSSFDWIINWVGGGDPSQLLLVMWIWPVEYRSHGNWLLSWQLCGAELSRSAFSCTSEGRYLGRGCLLGSSFCFFPWTLPWAGFHSCLTISHPRNRRTKMTFEDDFNLWYFLAWTMFWNLPLLQYNFHAISCTCLACTVW